MTRRTSLSIVIIAASIAGLGGLAFAAQDKYAAKVPDGLGFSDFSGFEAWQTVAVSQAKVQNTDLIEVILGNPAMIEAYKDGFPGNGKPVPDGAKMAKIHWTTKKSAEAPSPTTVPDILHDIDFMAKDGQRFAKTGGWGYAQFNYDNATDTFTPLGTGVACGYACHNIVKAKDYVFTAYGKR